LSFAANQPILLHLKQGQHYLLLFSFGVDGFVIQTSKFAEFFCYWIKLLGPADMLSNVFTFGGFVMIIASILWTYTVALIAFVISFIIKNSQDNIICTSPLQKHMNSVHCN